MVCSLPPRSNHRGIPGLSFPSFFPQSQHTISPDNLIHSKLFANRFTITDPQTDNSVFRRKRGSWKEFSLRLVSPHNFVIPVDSASSSIQFQPKANLNRRVFCHCYQGRLGIGHTQGSIVPIPWPDSSTNNKNSAHGILPR